MGNGIEYLLGQKPPEYETIRTMTVNGVKGSLIKEIKGTATHTNLPEYANTSEVYFRQSKHGVCQARVYLDRKLVLDFDWSHNHTNDSDGRKFKIGVVHVQMWKFNADGSKERLSDDARLMNNSEMKKYGPLLKKFCPTVKFRP